VREDYTCCDLAELRIYRRHGKTAKGSPNDSFLSSGLLVAPFGGPHRCATPVTILSKCTLVLGNRFVQIREPRLIDPVERDEGFTDGLDVNDGNAMTTTGIFE